MQVDIVNVKWYDKVLPLIPITAGNNSHCMLHEHVYMYLWVCVDV